ncbi:MAG: NUDIX domain-containing protein [Candidatus Aminicenantes bacterium]|nr:NUDIX domain-containing protein [Candidatus Aminicenantes bacterium]
MNKMDLLKTLAPGFLPLIIFILADSIWGTHIGLIVAVVFGIIEFIFSYIKEKVVDKFILLDLGLIVVLGVVSILLENDIFFKLKPALIELIFCFILGISVFSPVNIMMLMTRRYMKNIQLNEAQMQQFTRGLRVLFYLFLAHTVLIVYAAFFMSKGAWAFISGGLFYILFAVYFVIELIRARNRGKGTIEQYKDEEWFDIVDKEGKVINRAPRSVCHSGPGLMHPVVHVHIIDGSDRIFLQKRAMSKQIQPGKWDTAVGGHLLSGEKVEDGLKREAAEELGITEFKALFLARYVWETPVESELVFMFVSRYDKTIIINREEIEEGKFWKIKKIKESLEKGVFTPNFEFDFKILLENYFKL